LQSQAPSGQEQRISMSPPPGKRPRSRWQSFSITACESFPESSSTTVAIWPAHSLRTAFQRAAASGVMAIVTS
jgi:hypothetical protein